MKMDSKEKAIFLGVLLAASAGGLLGYGAVDLFANRSNANIVPDQKKFAFVLKSFFVGPIDGQLPAKYIKECNFDEVSPSKLTTYVHVRGANTSGPMLVCDGNKDHPVAEFSMTLPSGAFGVFIRDNNQVIYRVEEPDGKKSILRYEFHTRELTGPLTSRAPQIKKVDMVEMNLALKSACARTKFRYYEEVRKNRYAAQTTPQP